MYIIFGDDMKYKFIIPIALAIAIGFLTSNIFYSLFNNNIVENKKNSFFIELKNINDEQTFNNLKAYIKVKENGKEHICVGITSDKGNSEKIKTFYENKGYSVEVKQAYIDNEMFYNNLIQYDILLADVKREEDLISISKVILSSYEDQF